MSETLTLTGGGMTGSGCARHVTKALEALPGVASADVPGWESGRGVHVSTEFEPFSIELHFSFHFFS